MPEYSTDGGEKLFVEKIPYVVCVLYQNLPRFFVIFPTQFFGFNYRSNAVLQKHFLRTLYFF